MRSGIVYLKVKIKSLAEEARIIRKEEVKLKRRSVPYRPEGWERTLTGLHHHRIWDVRREARATHLAYGFLRGRALAQIEGNAKTCPPWSRVEAMVKKYGDLHAVDEPLKKWIAESRVTHSEPAVAGLQT